MLPADPPGDADGTGAGDAGGQAPVHRVRRTVLHGCGHGAARHTVLAGAGRHHGGAAGAGPPGAAGRGLGAAGDVRGVFHLLGQYGPDRAGADTVPAAAGPRDHAGGGADQSGHQQCARGHTAQPVYRRLPGAAGGGEHRRGGDAGGVAGQPDHLPGVYEARQGTDRTVPGTVLRRQLRLFGRAAGSHDVFDAIDRAPGLHGGKEADGSCSAICKSALTP